MKVIRTERLLIEEITKERFINLQKEPIESQLEFFNLTRDHLDGSTEFYTLQSKEDLETKIERMKDNWDMSLHFVMIDPTTIKTIGHCGFYRWFKSHRRSEIGYLLNKEYRKKGLVREAIAELIKYGFKELNLNRIEAIIEPENKDSIAIVEHFGFTKEGLLRQHYISKDKITDSMMYSLLKEECLSKQRE